MSVMVLVVAGLAGLSRAVQLGSEYSEGRGDATQHARVLIERITRSASEARANEQFPGFLVVSKYVGAWRFPDTLVVWRPKGKPADPNGLPRYGELVIYCPHSDYPNQLMEVTLPGDLRVVPPVSDVAAWEAQMAGIDKAPGANAVSLTGMVRACPLPEAGSGAQRAAVRFETRLLPSAADWASYKAGKLAWQNVPFAQSIRGPRAGLRQVWLRMEVQLVPAAHASTSDPAGVTPIPFFGSAAVYYELNR